MITRGRFDQPDLRGRRNPCASRTDPGDGDEARPLSPCRSRDSLPRRKRVTYFAHDRGLRGTNSNTVTDSIFRLLSVGVEGSIEGRSVNQRKPEGARSAPALRDR